MQICFLLCRFYVGGFQQIRREFIVLL